MKSARRIFGQALPASTFFVKVAQRFNTGQVEPKQLRRECVLKICLQVRFGSQQNHGSGLNWTVGAALAANPSRFGLFAPDGAPTMEQKPACFRRQV